MGGGREEDTGARGREATSALKFRGKTVENQWKYRDFYVLSLSLNFSTTTIAAKSVSVVIRSLETKAQYSSRKFTKKHN